MKQYKQYRTPVEIGRLFEQRTVKAFNKIGFAIVDRNKWNRNNNFYRDPATKRELDAIMYNSNNNQ